MLRWMIVGVMLAAGAARADAADDDWDDPKPPEQRTTDGFRAAQHANRPEPPRRPLFDLALRTDPAPSLERGHGPGEVFANDDAGDDHRAGKLSHEAIQGAVKPHMSEIRYCFQKDGGGGSEGRVFVRFTVAPSGQVTDAEVASSSIDNAAVEKCVAGAVRRWSFPRPTGGGSAVVTWPFMMVSMQ